MDIRVKLLAAATALATAVIAAPASAGELGPFYSFGWIACEQREVEGPVAGRCDIARGEGEPGFVAFVSPVTEEANFEDYVAFLKQVEPLAGVPFRTQGPGGVSFSPEEGEQARADFLTRLAELYGNRLEVVTVSFDRPDPADEAAFSFSEERDWQGDGLDAADGSVPPALQFLINAAIDLDRSSEVLVSMLRAQLANSEDRGVESWQQAHRANYLLGSNYLYRVGRLFPRFNRSMDFAALQADLGEEGVRPPVGAERGEPQYVQVAFLRHFLANDPDARVLLGTYLAALEELDATLDELSVIDPEDEGDRTAELRGQLPGQIDAFDHSFSALVGPLMQQLGGGEELAAALQAQMAGLEEESRRYAAERGW